MKDAYISGMDGMAIYASTDRTGYFVVRLDDDCARVTETSKTSFQLLHRQLQDNPKVIYHRNIPQHTIVKILMTEWRHDRAIRMALISVDPGSDAELQQEAEACLADLLQSADDKAWFAEHDPRKIQNVD